MLICYSMTNHAIVFAKEKSHQTTVMLSLGTLVFTNKIISSDIFNVLNGCNEHGKIYNLCEALFIDAFGEKPKRK